MAIRIFVPTYTTRSHSYSYNAFLQHVHVICTYGRIYCCHEVCSAVYRICGISGKNTAYRTPYILPYQHTTKHRMYDIPCLFGPYTVYRISSVCQGVPQLSARRSDWSNTYGYLPTRLILSLMFFFCLKQIVVLVAGISIIFTYFRFFLS